MYKCIIYEENKRKTLHLDMDTEDEIFTYAYKNNIQIVDIKEKQSLLKKGKLKDQDLKIFSKQMNILLKSGCDISTILKILIDQSNNKLRKVLKSLLNNIEKGNSITESFEQTKAFPQFYISMIRAGEISGNLDDVMDKLSSYYDKESKLKSKIISILIYPIILLITMLVSFLFILIFLIPNFENIYADNNISTPLITRILIFFSYLVRNHFLLIVVTMSFIILSLFYLKKRSKKVNDIFDKIIFRIPVIKTYSTLFIVNKFIKALSILIWSGVQIVEAIEISSEVISNKYIYKKISNANDLIKKGNKIGYSLKGIDELPPLFISMISVGEEGGKLDSILVTLSKYYENELDSRLEFGTKYFETFITLLIGVVVGVTVIAMMVPMFDAVTSI
ncbi:type II secretion system F family protein [Terrisporobacter mayombei]|nr:type II secretion system F family protein [Terrisporobacter mayombei]